MLRMGMAQAGNIGLHMMNRRAREGMARKWRLNRQFFSDHPFPGEQLQASLAF